MAFRPRSKKQRGMGFESRRRKICRFCENKIDYIDYKDEKLLRRFVTERGKIIPRRISGNCAKHQRELTTALKRGRQLALLPYTTDYFN
jgi:small subunit ribosomal protein S18